MNPSGTLSLELPRLVNGVVVINRHLGIVSLGEAHGAAFQNIDCREKVHVSAFLSQYGECLAAGGYRNEVREHARAGVGAFLGVELHAESAFAILNGAGEAHAVSGLRDGVGT